MELDTIICGDCLEVMKEIPDNWIDAIITDPPYFLPATHYQSRVNWGRKWSDVSVLTQWWGLICDSFKRILKPTGHILVFCNGDSYPAFYPAMYDRWDKLVCLVWDKQREGLGHIWRHSHELIIAARNEKAWVSSDGKLRRDVLAFKATPSKNRKHPAEKPIELLQELIEAVCPPGGIVLDPFLGSGSTAVATKKIERFFIGIELDPTYYEVARKRMGDIAIRGELFAEVR